jgi:hypothetical protein
MHSFARFAVFIHYPSQQKKIITEAEVQSWYDSGVTVAELRKKLDGTKNLFSKKKKGACMPLHQVRKKGAPKTSAGGGGGGRRRGRREWQ